MCEEQAKDTTLSATVGFMPPCTKKLYLRTINVDTTLLNVKGRGTRNDNLPSPTVPQQHSQSVSISLCCLRRSMPTPRSPHCALPSWSCVDLNTLLRI